VLNYDGRGARGASASIIASAAALDWPVALAQSRCSFVDASRRTPAAPPVPCCAQGSGVVRPAFRFLPSHGSGGRVAPPAQRRNALGGWIGRTETQQIPVGSRLGAFTVRRQCPSGPARFCPAAAPWISPRATGRRPHDRIPFRSRRRGIRCLVPRPGPRPVVGSQQGPSHSRVFAG